MRTITDLVNFPQIDMHQTNPGVCLRKMKINLSIELLAIALNQPDLVQKIINLGNQNGGAFFSRLSNAPATRSFSNTPVNFLSSNHVLPPVTFRGFVLLIKSGMS